LIRIVEERMFGLVPPIRYNKYYEKNCALNPDKGNLNYKFCCFLTELRYKIQLVLDTENRHSPGSQLKGDTNKLNFSQFW